MKIIKIGLMCTALSFGFITSASAFPENFPYVPHHMRKKVQRMLNNMNGLGNMGSASPACATIICLAPYVGMGTSGGPACLGPNQTYFSIRVFDPWSGYDPDLTQAVRGAYLRTCPDPVNAGTAALENMTVGTWFNGN